MSDGDAGAWQHLTAEERAEIEASAARGENPAHLMHAAIEVGFAHLHGRAVELEETVEQRMAQEEATVEDNTEEAALRRAKWMHVAAQAVRLKEIASIVGRKMVGEEQEGDEECLLMLATQVTHFIAPDLLPQRLGEDGDPDQAATREELTAALRQFAPES